MKTKNGRAGRAISGAENKPSFDFILNFRVSSKLVDVIDVAAEIEGCSSRTEFARQALNREAHRILRVHKLRQEWEKKEAEKE